MKSLREDLIIFGLTLLTFGSIYFAFNYLTVRRENYEKEFGIFMRRDAVNIYRCIDGRAIGVFKEVDGRAVASYSEVNDRASVKVYEDVGPDMDKIRRKFFEERNRVISERLLEER